MKEYQLSDGSVVNFSQLAEMHPEKSFPRDEAGVSFIDPSTLLCIGASEVCLTVKPSCKPTQFVQRSGVEVVNGVAQEKWEVVEKTVADKVSFFKASIQAHMDNTAIAHRYYSLESAVSYAALPVGEPYQDEGMAFLVWRARVWKECYVILDKVLTGVLPEPTIEELIAILPQLVLPS